MQLMQLMQSMRSMQFIMLTEDILDILYDDDGSSYYYYYSLPVLIPNGLIAKLFINNYHHNSE